MKKFYSLVAAVWFALAAMASAESVPLVYGVRIASSNEAHHQGLVSFAANNPSVITDEFDLSAYHVLTAACDGNDYFMVVSADGIVPSALMKLNLGSKKMTTVATYDWKVDLAGSLMLQDMTYDPRRKMLYAVGYDLSSAELVDDEVDAPFGVFAIDPATGSASTVGFQEVVALWTVAANNSSEWFAIGDNGVLWLLDPKTGLPQTELLKTGVRPYASQSMSFDHGSGVCYWASVTRGADGEGYESTLLTLQTGSDKKWSMSTVGAMADNSVVIGLYVDPEGFNPAAPTAIKSLKAEAAANGAASAKLSWTNPTLTQGGATLGAFGVKVYRDGTLVATLENCSAGGMMTWTDTNVPTGLHTYSVAPFTSAAEARSFAADEIYVGVDLPGMPVGVVATLDADRQHISINWSAPNSGAHNGWFDASAVKYDVVRMPGNVKVAENLSNRSFTDVVSGSTHGYYYLVSASTAAGQGPAAKSNVVITGDALTPPYLLDLTDEDHENSWTVVDGDGDGYAWYVEHEMWGGTSHFFRYYPENTVDPAAAADEWLISPSFKLEQGKHYVATYHVRLLGDLFPANSSLFIGTGASKTEMTTMLEDNENEVNDIAWSRHAVPFTVDESGAYNLGYRVANMVPVQWDKFTLEEVELCDLAVSTLEGDATMNRGQKALLKAVVTNRGFKTVESYKVELVDAMGATLVSTTIKEPLPCYASAAVELAWTPETEGSYELKARVVGDGDLNNANNISPEVFAAVVGGDGATVDIVDGTTGSGYLPFYPSYRHSATQTIYTADELADAPEGFAVTAMKYYIYNMYTSDPHEVNLKVSLANVDADDFESADPIAHGNFTEVFDGSVTMSKGDESFTFTLDQPFVYTGGNLCVYTRHENVSDATPSIIFRAKYGSADPKRSLVYRDAENPFDFSQEMAAYKDRPNLTLFMERPAPSAVDIVGGEKEVEVAYDRASRQLTIDGVYDVCRVYNATGRLLGQYSGAPVHSLAILEGSGVAIVEILNPAGRTIAKVVL